VPLSVLVLSVPGQVDMSASPEFFGPSNRLNALAFLHFTECAMGIVRGACPWVSESPAPTPGATNRGGSVSAPRSEMPNRPTTAIKPGAECGAPYGQLSRPWVEAP
jgi:hypothetical protein